MRIETKKVSPVRLTFTIIAVFLTVFFVPFLLIFPLGGGVAYGVVSFGGSSDLADVMEADNFSDNFYKIAVDEIRKNLEDENDINPNAWQGFIKEIISTDDMAEMVHSVAEALRTGKDMDYNFDGIKERYQSKAKEMEEVVSEDLYQAVVYEKDSEYFSTTCVLRARTAILRNVNFSSISELKKFFYSKNSEQADFDKFMRTQWNLAKEDFYMMDSTEVIGKMDEIMVMIEEKVSEIQSELHREPAVNKVLSMLQNGKFLYFVVYGIILFCLIVLLLMYWFAPGACFTLGVFSFISFANCYFGAAFLMGKRQEYWIEDFYEEAGIEEEYRIFTETIQRVLDIIASRIRQFGFGMVLIGAALFALGILMVIFRKKKVLRSY